jgi:hypothetical protein
MVRMRRDEAGAKLYKAPCFTRQVALNWVNATG